MNYNNEKQQFEKYLDGYDSNNDKVRLKIIHTYGVVHAMEEICHRMQLSEEDTKLARIIALLHDIGRFEQLKRFDSIADQACMKKCTWIGNSFKTEIAVVCNGGFDDIIPGVYWNELADHSFLK